MFAGKELEFPSEIDGATVIACALVPAYTPTGHSTYSRVLARAITNPTYSVYVLHSITLADDDEWLQDGASRHDSYSVALAMLSQPRINIGEFANSI